MFFFKWFGHISDHKRDIFFVQFSDNHAKTGQFDNQPCLDHLNTSLVRYSDSYCIRFPVLSNDLKDGQIDLVF